MDIQFSGMIIEAGGAERIQHDSDNGEDVKTWLLSMLLEECHNFALQARAVGPSGYTALKHAEMYAMMYQDLEATRHSEWLATDLFNQTWALNIYMDDDSQERES